MSPEAAGRIQALNEFGLYVLGPLGIIFIVVSIVLLVMYKRRKHINALLAKDGVKISGKVWKVDLPKGRRPCRVSYYFNYAGRQWDGIQSVKEYYIYKMKLAQGSVLDILYYPPQPWLSRIEPCELETSLYFGMGIFYLILGILLLAIGGYSFYQLVWL